jgi:hypothetical protein
MNPEVALVYTVHDPEFRIGRVLKGLLPGLALPYRGVWGTASPETSEETVKLLGRLGPVRRDTANRAIGVARRQALRLALDGPASFFHYCDLDRFLHWVRTYPGELRGTVERIVGCDYLVIGRTARAFATHPECQRLTEAITNRVGMLVIRRFRPDAADWDFAAGSAALSRAAAAHILACSRAESNATDLEWPVLAAAAGFLVEFMAVEGLEFETADYYPEEVAAFGSVEAWVEGRNTLAEWVARTRLTYESLLAARDALQSSAKPN